MKEKEKRKFIRCGKNRIATHSHSSQKDPKYLNNMQHGKKKVLLHGSEHDAMHDTLAAPPVVAVADDHTKTPMPITRHPTPLQ